MVGEHVGRWRLVALTPTPAVGVALLAEQCPCVVLGPAGRDVAISTVFPGPTGREVTVDAVGPVGRVAGVSVFHAPAAG